MEKENVRGKRYKEENVNTSKTQSTKDVQDYHRENLNFTKYIKEGLY